MEKALQEGVARLQWQHPVDAAADLASTEQMFLVAWTEGLEEKKPDRVAAWQHFCTGPLQSHTSCAQGSNPAAYDVLDYYRSMRKHQFVVSARGTGLASYR